MTTDNDDSSGLDLKRFREEVSKQKLIYIAATIKECGDILMKKPAKKPRLPKDAPEPSGPFYIDPTIVSEYKSIVGIEMPVSKLLDLYSSWCAKTSLVITKNQEFLWNSAVYKHCLENFEVISSAMETFGFKPK